MKVKKRKVVIAIIVIIVIAGFVLFKNDEAFSRVSLKIKQPSFSSFDDVLKHPQNVTVISYKTGSITSPLSGLVNLKHPKMKNIRDREMLIPVLAHVVYHKKHGNMLIDTGLDALYQTKPFGSMQGFIVKYVLGKGTQKPGQNISSIIKKDNITLARVFFTHLHFDHIAGALDLPAGIQYISGKNEIFMNNILFRSNHLNNIKKLYEIDFTNTTELQPLGKAVDVFGDNSVWAIDTSGHTKGHTSFFINGKKQKVLILGDAALRKTSLITGVGPGTYSSDIQKSQKTLDKIMAFKKKYPAVKIVCGHEL